MASRKLDKSEWEAYFNKVSSDHQAKLVEVEVLSKSIGSQVEEEWVPILGLSYDPKDDDFSIATEAVDHIIHRPVEIWVDDEAGMLNKLEVVQADGTKHIVELRNPEKLPPA